MFTIEPMDIVQPPRYLLAYACDDKDKYDRERDQGSLKVWGFPSE